jgi:hypothetical protein
MVAQHRWSLLVAGLVAMFAGCGGSGGSSNTTDPNRFIIDGGTAADAPLNTDIAIALGDAGIFHIDAVTAPGGEQGPNPFDLPMAVSSGGSVLASPRVQAIYFSGFPYTEEMDRLLANLAAGTYWGQVTSEYGVGALTVLPGDQNTGDIASAITDAEIPALFEMALMAHASTLGPPRGDTIYVLFLPPTTSLSIAGRTFCGRAAPSAYHQEITVSGVAVPVVVVPTCSTFAGEPALTGADAIAPAVAHELVEAATDPLPDSAPAFDTTDPPHIIWTVAVSGGEVADLCENEAPNLITPADIGFPVPRVWSNAAARGMGGPCVPVPPDTPYFTAVAHLPETLRVQPAEGPVVVIPALVAAVGSAATVTVDLRAGPGAPSSWQVLALEYHGPDSMTSATAGMSAAVVGHAGETRSIPIVAPAAATRGVFPLIILSHSTEGALHLWVGAIQRR